MSTVPAGHKIITRTSAITANYKKTDPQRAIGDPEGIFIKKDTGRTIFGVGTKTPYSRISMGQIGSSLADQTPALAFTEDSSGNYASGISFYKENDSKINLRFSINKLKGAIAADIDKTRLEYTPTNVDDAPILSLTKTIETVEIETLENGQEANTGNKVFINCIQPIRGGLSQRSGLEVNGMISLTDRLNFFRTSIVEEVPTGALLNQIAISLYHEQADGSKKEILTRTGQNRVIDASHSLISVLPNTYTNGPRVDYTTDPSGIFLFKNCDFVIGNGEMAASSQLGPNNYTDKEYWERFNNISTSFLNLRGNTFFGSVFDISSAEIVPIVSKACENVDYSRNGVLYLQNNLGIGSYQPRAIIDCSKVDLPFLMMGREINGISNNTVAFGDELNIPLANYSFIFGKDHDLSGSPQIYNSNYNFIFGKNIDTSIPNRLNYNFAYGKNHSIQGDYNFIFGNNNRLSADVSYCTLLGYDGKIDASGVNSAVMKYTLGNDNDIFVLTREGDINILKDICCNDICSNEIIVKYIAKPNQYAENAYINDISAVNISLEKDLICDDIVCDSITVQTEGTVPLFKVTTRLEAKDTYTDDNYFLKGKKILHTSGNTLNIDSSSNIIFNTNQTNKIYINNQGDFSIGVDNSTPKGTLYAKANTTTLTNSDILLEGLQFGGDGNYNYYLRLGSLVNKKTNIEFGKMGLTSTNKIVYDDNENSLNTYYNGSYNIYNGNTKKISITSNGVEINAPLTLIQSELTTQDFTISNGGRIHFENASNKIEYTGSNFKNTYNNNYSIYHNTIQQIVLNSSQLDIKCLTNIHRDVTITGELIVNGIDVGAGARDAAGGSKWKATTSGDLYIANKVAINIEKENVDNPKNPFLHFFPKFDFDISGNLRTYNMLLGRPVLNMISFDMKTNNDNVLTDTYSKGIYQLSESNPNTTSIWNLFDNSGATYWKSEKRYTNKNTNTTGTTVEKSNIIYNDISQNYTIVQQNISLSGERIDITLPQLWTLKYYGFKPPIISSDLSKNMPSKWYIIAKKGSTSWKLIDEKDISNNENNYFQEDKYYYFNLDLSNNFARDNYTKFGFIFNQIFNDGEDPNALGTYLDISCNIGGIQLFGALNSIPDFSSNIIQTDVQNNTVNYDDISHVNQKKTKHLSLQPFGGRVGIYNMKPKVILDISANDAIRLPVGDNNFKNTGTTSDFKGCIRFNTDDSQFEGCDGQNWGGLGGVISLDQQTKIVATDASGLKFINDGFENVIIDESGNVGIGNMIPRVILDISSNQAIRLPAGTTSERPFVSPHIFPELLKEKYKGSIRFNTDTALFEGYYGTEEAPLEQWKGFNEVITKTIDICCNDVSFNGNLTGDNAIIHDISLINVYAKTDKIKIHSDICGNDASFNNISINDISCNGTFFISTAADISNIYVNGGIVDLSNASMVIVPQLSQDNSSNNVATTGYVRSAISDLIGGAPDALDTLKELSDFLQDDQVSEGLLQKLATKQNTLTFNAPSSNNANPSTSAQIKTALDLKQNNLTFNAPSSNNANPSTSAEIKTALDLKANLAGPIFTGTPKITVDGTDINIATTTDVNNSAGVWTDSSTHIHYSNNVSIGANVNVAPLALVNTNNLSFLSNHDKGIYLGIINSTNNPLLQFVAAADQSSYLDFKDITNNSDHYKGRIEHNNTSGFSFYTNETKCIDITTAGQISFGPSVPSNWTQDSYPIKMDVTGNIRCDRLFVSNKDANGDANGTFQDIESLISGGGSGAFTVNGNDIYYNTGNVGIGTTSPDTKLHVNGDFHIEGTSDAWSTTGKGLYFRFHTNPNYGYIQCVDYTAGASGWESLQLDAMDYRFQANGATKMFIDSNGKVGIGTSSPRATLNVTNNVSYYDTESYIIPSAYGGNPTTTCVLGHGVTDGEPNYWGLNIGTIWDGRSYIQGCHTNGTSFYELLLNPKGGNVGIGKETTNYKLDVNGTIGATGNITAYYSDERLKTFKGKITQPIEKIKNLNGYYFVENELAKSLGYNNDKLQVGVSAQEVEKVLPEIVTKAPIDKKYKTVWYEKLTPLLIEGIKAQQTQIDQQQTQIDQQQAQMAEQQAQIDELKALVQSLME